MSPLAEMEPELPPDRAGRGQGGPQGWARRVASHPLLPWYAGLLAGILPVLLIGFLYSALADRLEFAGWALVVTAFYTVALRQGMQAGWPASRLAGILVALLGAGTAAFAWIMHTHHEILDLGFRAVLPETVYVSIETDPRAAAMAAAILVIAGLGLAAGGAIARARRSR
jgi:hypothetical protein